MQRGTKKENLFAKAFGTVTNEEDAGSCSGLVSYSCPFEHGYEESPDDPNAAASWKQVKKTKPKKSAGPSEPSGQTESTTTATAAAAAAAVDVKVYNKESLERVDELLKSGVKLMVIMRGASGSGKSTLAKQVKHDGVICSADDYFLNNNNVYVFDAAKLSDAHVFCRTQAREALKKSISPVVIDNTHSCIWEFKPYVKMAIEHGYQIEIIEPKTPWCDKPAVLAEVNKHRVPLATIKKFLKDFEKCDLALLIDKCKADMNTKRGASTIANAKPGSFITNYSEYIKSDWTLPELDAPAEPASSVAASGLLKSASTANNAPVRQDFLSSLTLGDETESKKKSLGESASAPNEKSTNGGLLFDTSSVISEKDLERSTSEIKQLFPDIETEIIVDFLLKYENDVDMVTNLLLDSVNLNDVKVEPPPPPPPSVSGSGGKPSPSGFSLASSQSSPRTPARSKRTITQVESLKTLCISALNSFDFILRNSYDINANELLYNLTYMDMEEQSQEDEKGNEASLEKKKAKSKLLKLFLKRPLSLPESSLSDPGPLKPFMPPSMPDSPTSPILSNSQDDAEKSGEKQQTETNTASSSDSGFNESEDPLLKFRLDKKLLGSLIELFGDSTDEKNLQNNKLDVEIGFNMAYKLFSCWRKTIYGSTRESSPTSKYSAGKLGGASQTRSDSLVADAGSLVLEDDLDQIARDEMLSMQLFDELNMRDPINQHPVYLSEKENSAQQSLRQIMAEQMAEQALEKSGVVVRKSSSTILNDKLALKKTDSSNDISSKLKLKQLYEKYEHLVDKKMIDQIFKNFKNNFDDTCKYIDEFFQLSGEAVREPVNKFKMTSPSVNKSPLAAYARQSSAETRTKTGADSAAGLANNKYQNDQRVLANKYVNLRQDYFDKAHEAYTRGWKNVAYYYSMLGHKQSENIRNANKEASMEILMANNPDLGNTNTLDLHGLYMKEAIDVLKQFIHDKKQELMYGKSKKTILFVITGYGKHSESGPRLRPSVINYLNTNKITYQETHAGLFRISLI